MADPSSINYSQRNVNANVLEYTEDMKQSKWFWSDSGPVRVMNVDGQLVAYDNRRLMAAQDAGLKNIPIQIVNPNDIIPGSKMTWKEAFDKRFNDPRNIKDGGAVPRNGLSQQPRVRTNTTAATANQDE
jgi:hypothetical protein